jgi:hypothetical protein
MSPNLPQLANHALIPVKPERSKRFVSQYDTSLICAQLMAAGNVAALWKEILSRAPGPGSSAYTPRELARRRQLYQARKARRAAA